MSEKMLKEVDKVSDKLQQTSQKLDYIREITLQHDKAVLQTKITQLKQSDGEDWAIGETIRRILELETLSGELLEGDGE